MGRSSLRSAFIAWCVVLTVASSALAETRGVFVSPTTGVSVGSVWGVFIGVSQYQQKDLNLKYADKDAQALHAFFVDQFKGRVPADQFRLLTNSQATRGKVLKEVSEVLRLAQPEDLVILSLAMHGLPDTSGNDLYFLSYNADANLPEDQGISRDDLLKQIARSKARKIVLLIDACHAGAFGASSTLLAMRSANAADINRMLVAMGQAQDGIAVLSASSAAERSQEGPQFCGGHGAFTCALLNGLKGGADADGNGLIQMRELYDYTYREVKRQTTGYQNPEIQGRYDNGLPLAATGKVTASSSMSAVTPPMPGPSASPSKAEQELQALQDQERQVEEEAKQVELQRQIEEKKRQIEEKKNQLQIARARPYEAPHQSKTGQPVGAIISTKFGQMEIKFFPDRAPVHVANFIKLAKEGFYNGTIFHRVIPGFMIQGGDPNTKDAQRTSEYGKGGPGYSIKAEFNDTPHNRGIVSMARSAAPDSAGSQFFIVVQDARFLDRQYTVFGEIVRGMDVADRIVSQPRDSRDNPTSRIEMAIQLID